MEKITTIKQATQYVYNQLQKINPEVSKEDVYDTILDEVLESIEYTLQDEDMKFLEENEKDSTAIDEYLASILPEYADLLEDIVTDMISEEDKEETN